MVAVAVCFPLALPVSAEQAEDVLRQRVKEFYTLLQQGQVTRAEAYVTRDTLDQFRKSAVGPILGLEISSVALDSSGNSATVTVQILYRHPMVSGSLLRFPRTTTWRLEEGAWRVAVLTQQAPDTIAGMAQGGEAPPALPDELRFSEKTQDLGLIKAEEKKTIRFSFQNIAGHPVTISGVETGCPCLTVQSENKTYQPGENGELVLEFDPSGYLYNFAQTMVVKTEPGSRTTLLMVKAVATPRQSVAPAPSPSSASSGSNP
jgi:hypothetical protein